MKQFEGALAVSAVLFLSSAAASGQEILRQWTDVSFGDDFGNAVALSADLTGDGIVDLVVGAPYADCASTDDGECFIYSGSDGSFVTSFCGSADGFAAQLAVAGDVDGDGVPELWIGAPRFSSPVTGNDTGRAKLLSGATGTLLFEMDGEAYSDEFGIAVAALGDLDGDGAGDLLVGADAHSVGSLSGCGRVYLYSGATGLLIRSHDGVATADRFGSDVAGVGDVDGDGIDDYAIGATLYSANVRGSVHVYSGQSGTLLWTVTGSHAYEDLGSAIAGGLDWNGDGLGDVIVGTPSNGPRSPGAIQVLSGFDGSLLVSGTGNIGEGFGRSLAVAGDMDGDGFPEIVVGAPLNSTGVFIRGRASLRSGRTLRELYDFEAPLVTGFALGQSVGGGVDLNGDAIPDFVIGALGGTPVGSIGGQVTLYAGNDLFLQASATDVSAGDSMTIFTRGGAPGAIDVVVLTDVNGTPLFDPLIWSSLDANGESSFGGKVPPGFAGITFTLRAFAQKSPGGSGVIDSSDATIAIH